MTGFTSYIFFSIQYLTELIVNKLADDWIYVIHFLYSHLFNTVDSKLTGLKLGISGVGTTAQPTAPSPSAFTKVNIFIKSNPDVCIICSSSAIVSTLNASTPFTLS